VSVELVSAAAVALAPAPTDAAARAKWLGDVEQLALALFRSTSKVQEQTELLERCTPITGVIRSVKEVSNRAVISFEPTIGDHEPGTTEDVRTPWLNEPQGAALAELAASLIGVECRMGKWLDEVTTGANKGRRIRMVAWIEPIGQPAAQPATQPESPRPPAEQPAQPEPDRQQQEQQPPPADPTVQRFAELRRLEPASTGEVLRLAKEHLDVGEQTVKGTAASVLRPLAQGATRTPAECKTLWVALCDAVEPF
jgi:hypothetical protein